MTLDDLTEQLSPEFPASVQKDVKTAVRILAQSLNYPDAKSCPLTDCLRPLAEIYRLVEPRLVAAGKGPHTIRNTKNNLSRLFRLAEARGHFSLPPAVPIRRFPARRAGGRRYTLVLKPDGSYLRRAQWPTAVEEGFAAFAKWATDPLVNNRDIRLRKRLTTIEVYEFVFESYFGYLHHVRYINPITFDHLYDFTFIQSYVHWHINEKHNRATIQIHQFLTRLLALVRQYRQDPVLAKRLKEFQLSVPKPQPFYNKSDVWLPLHELRRIATALWPAKPLNPLPTPQIRQAKQPGMFFAGRAGISLMFHLWTYIPYRPRNMCEMEFGKHLHKTPDGQWHIRFVGEDMKIGRKQGRLNVFDLLFPPALVPLLETYLQEWRPVLQQGQDLPHVFLNAKGRPFTARTLRLATSRHVYIFTGRPWHPHIVRSVWPTEWINHGGDLMTAAIMLNDRLQTVIENYAYLLDQNVAEKAYQWSETLTYGH
jgi:hypothetical protein